MNHALLSNQKPHQWQNVFTELNIITGKVNLIPDGGMIMPLPYLKSCHLPSAL
jgi:hypothetical protein